MITWKEAYENPELMIKYKDDLKDVGIFKNPWYAIFRRHPYLYREFSDRFDEMGGWDIRIALGRDPTLVLDLKNHLYKLDRVDMSLILREVPALALDLKDYLHKLNETDDSWLSDYLPGLSLCLKYRDYPDRAEVAYYVGYPHELNNLNKEEKREMGKRIIEFLKEEKA